MNRFNRINIIKRFFSFTNVDVVVVVVVIHISPGQEHTPFSDT
jgi:hypothetical protein